jgi:hypothetical protein
MKSRSVGRGGTQLVYTQLARSTNQPTNETLAGTRRDRAGWAAAEGAAVGEGAIYGLGFYQGVGGGGGVAPHRGHTEKKTISTELPPLSANLSFCG